MGKELRFMIMVRRQGEPIHHSIKLETENFGGIDNLDTVKMAEHFEHLVLVEAESEQEGERDDSRDF